ncbi:MAG: hypothetical protein JRJ35_12895 [Deltaproteobacteria bacterium]|nr:hypothetical protein [Deltaproteobacteria bacterium]MBW1951054.1 hypothetical protein [Deltaproteobacteria bacterium]
MKRNGLKIFLLFVGAVFLGVGLGGCAALKGGPPAATLNLTPDKIVLSPVLIKKPVVFTGSGFGPKEIVVIELLLPKGVTVKGVPEGENAALGNGTTDEKGNLKTKMGVMTTLNTLFQVGWTPLIKPDFKQARPLPPGTYDVIATGMYSDRVAKAKLTILPPPKKKK